MDYYSILGVLRNASPEEIKKAYRKQAMANHPDRGGDVSVFQGVQEAYEILSDPHKRQQYDNPQRRYTSHNFEDIFAQRRYARNRDITIGAKLDLKDVFTGKNLIANFKLFSGRVETVTIDVPAGASHGTIIRFAGLGDDSIPGPRGNLFVKVQINDPKGFARDGNELYQEVHINVLDMILGCVYTVTTLDGRTLNLKIPKGTQANAKFNIKNYGFPKMRNPNIRGDLIVIVSPFIPNIENESIRRKLSKLRNNLDK